MVHKPIVRFVIAPVTLAGILIMTILAATANAQENNNSTGNAQESNSTGNAQENSNAGNARQENSNAGNARQESNSTENATSPSGSTASNNTGNASADFVNTILEIHNRERAAVGVPPLVWSDELAAHAKDWAEHLATQLAIVHCLNVPGCDTHNEGENLAGGMWPNTTLHYKVEQLVQIWVSEKNNYHNGPITDQSFHPMTLHYTQMV
jgi:Cysteine-rich secretory protein family